MIDCREWSDGIWSDGLGRGHNYVNNICKGVSASCRYRIKREALIDGNGIVLLVKKALTLVL